MLDLAQLEDRLLLSAAPAGAAVLAGATPDTSAAGASLGGALDAGLVDPLSIEPSGESSRSISQHVTRHAGADARHEVVFLDSGVADADVLDAGLRERHGARVQYEIVRLDADRDGIAQISEALASRHDIDSVHFITHATDRAVKLGSTWLARENVAALSDVIQGWRDALTGDADLLFYGCELAGSQAGRDVLESIGELTGADIAASRDDTGSRQLGGDWRLEYRSGRVESRIAVTRVLRHEWSGLLDSFLVTTTNDSGEGSFRQAIQNANALPGLDTINFNIAGGGLRTINVLSALPVITDSVVIDGATQPGFTGQPLIELNGSAAGSNTVGLTIAADDSTIRGLIINRFGADGIRLLGSNTRVVGNYLGTDATGMSGLGNGSDGIEVNGGNNTIGGATAWDRNVISGNLGDGLDLSDTSTGNIVIGNYIGTDVAGLAAIANGTPGVVVDGGVHVDGVGNRIGGAAAGEANLISGNLEFGVLIRGQNNLMLGNQIGLDANGLAGLGNQGEGIRISAGFGSSGNSIGGLAAGAGNVIASNTRDGILIESGAGSGNTIQRNRVFANGELGINLQGADGAFGVTANDSGDGDSGPNGLQNYPVLVSAVTNGTNVTINGSLNGQANTTFLLDFFASAAGDASSHGEAERYLGSAAVTTDATGNISFSRTFVAAVALGEHLTATATDALGNTSEFSLNAAAVSLAGLNEFRANSTTSNTQHESAIAIDGACNFVVVWTSDNEDGDSDGIYGQRYNAAGTAVGLEFLVNTTTSKDQSQPAVAMDEAGNFVVVWASDNQDGDRHGIFAQRFDSSGARIGGEFQVTSTFIGDQVTPSVAMNALGQFVVAWQTDAGGSSTDIKARVFNADGTAAGAEFAVNDDTSGKQDNPTAAIADNGDFVIAWYGNQSGGEIWARQFNAGGSPGMPEFLVSASASPHDPTAGMAGNGDFVISWTANDASGKGVFASRYDASGTAIAGDFQVNTETNQDQENPSLTMDRLGAFLVAWTSNNQDGNNKGIFAQRFDASGAAVGGEFQVNSTTNGTQEIPAAALCDLDKLVVVWQGNGSGDSLGVFGRMFESASSAASNAQPVADAGGPYSVNEGGSITLNASSSSDPDSDPLTYAWDLNNDQIFGDRFGVTPALTWADLVGFGIADDGTYLIAVQVTDGNGGADTATTTINISNTAPTAANNSGTGFTTSESAAFTTANVLGNDNDPSPNDPLVVNSINTSMTQGIVTSNGNGTFQYDPNGQFESLATGQQATDQFTYTISDGDGGTATATVAITIQGANDPPTITGLAGDTLSYAEGSGVQVIEQGGNATVTDEDSLDFDGGSLTVSFIAGSDLTQDILSIRDQGSGSGQIGYTLGMVQYEGTTIGTAVGGSLGVNLEVTFNANATATAVSALVRNITYENNALFAATLGARTVRFVVRDGDGGSSSNTDTNVLVVSSGAPTADAGGPYFVNEGGSVTLDASASSDPDGDPLTYLWDLNGDMVYGDATGVTSVLTWTDLVSFGIDDDGAYTVRVRVEDVHAGFAVESATITLSNSKPTAVNDAGAGFVSTQDAPFTTANVLGNDSDPSPSDPLSIIGFDTSTTLGQVTNNGDGTFHYDPADRFNFLASGQQATDQFRYTIDDGDGGNTTATVTITIWGANDSPAAAADSFGTAEDSTLKVDAAGVLANDSDPDGDPLTAVLVSGPTHGVLAVNADGSFEYVPQSNFSGSDSFTYQATDGSAESSVVTVSITVQPSNDAPDARDDAFVMDADGSLIVPAAGVLANDRDIDGDPLSATLVAGPSNGVVTIGGKGSFTYTPNAGFAGTDMFTYKASDGASATVATVTITVRAPAFVPINQGPPVTPPPIETTGDPEPPTPTVNPTSASLPAPPAQPGAGNDPARAARSGLASQDGAPTTLDRASVRSQAFGLHDLSFADWLDRARRGDRAGRTGERFGSADLQFGDSGFVVHAAALWEDLQTLTASMKSDAGLGGVAVGSAVTSAMGLSVGYLIWLLRSGYLVSSLLASMPAWRLIDPLPVLESLGESCDSDDEDDECLESLVAESETNPPAEPDTPSEPNPPQTCVT